MKRMIVTLLLFISIYLNAVPATEHDVKMVVRNFISDYKELNSTISLKKIEFINNEFFLVSLEPNGFVIIAKDTDLNPILGYSFRNNFSENTQHKDLFTFWFKELQDKQLSNHSLNDKTINNNLWFQREVFFNDFQQWPPANSTSTGGWLETNWTQSSPYNDMCPIDPTTNSRSAAGCPSVAMTQIINYHRNINNTNFNETDKYKMYFSSSNTYMIDNDYLQRGFPNFEELNGYLNQIQTIYSTDEELDNTLKAAIIFAGGVAIRQSYSTEISGNFFNHQILNGFHRFGYDSATMLYVDSPMVYDRIIDNMKSALPAQLSALTPDGSGHQIVVDGYNTNQKVHLNFGWGGQANGWYNLPLSGIPYQLNIFGAIVLDINQNWESSPDFTLNLESSIINNNILTYSINSTSSETESYKVYINNNLIAEHFSAGTFHYSISSLDNTIYQITVIASSYEGKLCVKNDFFNILRGEIIYQESFDDDNWFYDWEIISSNTAYTWQQRNNILENFSYYDNLNTFSMTCPVAYSGINEKLRSPLISLPDSDNLELSFHIAMADQYPTYPGLRLEISQDYGNTWNTAWQYSGQGERWQWRPIIVDLDYYSGANIMLQFVANGFSYVDVSVDNIKIFDTTMVATSDQIIKPIMSSSVYPNPFFINNAVTDNSMINIMFELKKSEKINVDVFDIRGRKVAQISDSTLSKGQHHFSWNISDLIKNPASGIYFIRIKSCSQQTLNKVLIIK